MRQVFERNCLIVFQREVVYTFLLLTVKTTKFTIALLPSNGIGQTVFIFQGKRKVEVTFLIAACTGYGLRDIQIQIKASVVYEHQF